MGEKQPVFGKNKLVFGNFPSFLGKISPFLGIFHRFWENQTCFWGFSIVFGKNKSVLGKRKRGFLMKGTYDLQKKGFKGRCEKRNIRKSKDVCRFYSQLQMLYGNILQESPSVIEITCNVPIELEQGEYTSDFLCKKENNDYMVRECVQKSHLLKPMTAKLLEASRAYWKARGIDDWGLVVERGEANEEK